MPQKLADKFNQIDRLLKKAGKVMIAAHENPDPDALASVLALHYFFKRKNLQSFPYLPDPPPKNLSFLPGFFEIRSDCRFLEEGGWAPSDLLFCLDYGDFKRLRIPGRVLAKIPSAIITIDHHLQGDQKGAVQIVEPGFSSTAEIIYQWMLYENFQIGRELAGCILAGIFSDSGGLRHVSTSSATFRTVSELLSRGVSLDKIVRSSLAFPSVKTYPGISRAWGRILDQIKLDKRTGLAYSWIRAEDLKKFGIEAGDFDGPTNLIAAASPACLGLFLLEHKPGEIRGSLRSEPSGGVDVARIAKAVGGGGHSYAAGFQCEGSIEEVLKKVLNLLE